MGMQGEVQLNTMLTTPVAPSKQWRFRVKADVQPGQILCVTGDCDALGNWQPHAVFRLAIEDTFDSAKQKYVRFWNGLVDIPSEQDIHYRYCICSFSGKDGDKVMIHLIESSIYPRMIAAKCPSNVQSSSDVIEEMFGYAAKDGSLYIVNDGPLYSDIAVQLILSKSSFLRWPACFANKEVSVKVTPLLMDAMQQQPLSPTYNPYHVCSESENENKFAPATLISASADIDNQLRNQDSYGHPLAAADGFLVFLTRTFSLELTAFMLSFYTSKEEGEKKTLAGFGHVLLNKKQSSGEVTVPVNCVQYGYLAHIAVKYLIVQPSVNVQCDLQMPFSKFWKDSWKGLEIGHRGTGVSFSDRLTNNATIRENTIGSLKNAGLHGADMVEFDVQLSRDMIPAIYHDFHVLIAIQNNNSEHTTKLKMPVQDFSSEELRSLMIHHLKEKDGRRSFLHDSQEEYQPFPTLQNAFKEIDPFVGFNVEVKYTLEHEDGVPELEYPLDMNQYVDTILQVVFLNAGSRYVVFSSFHPDICIMLKMKQNKYPVLFLTQGTTSKYRKYQDFRAENLFSAVQFARATNILGVNVHAEDLLREPHQIEEIVNSGLVLFCWGEDNNNQNVLQFFKDKGVHGIIFDKFDVITQKKEDRRSIFEKEQFLLNAATLKASATYEKNVKQFQD